MTGDAQGARVVMGRCARRSRSWTSQEGRISVRAAYELRAAGRAMSVEKVVRKNREVVWRVRWRQDGRNRARTFSTRRDALDFDAEVRRQRRARSLGALDAGTESLGEYVTEAWAVTHAVTLRRRPGATTRTCTTTTFVRSSD